LEATGEAFRRFEPAYRQPEWMVAPVKFDDRSVAADALRSFDQVQNPNGLPALTGIRPPRNDGPALFAVGYEEAGHRLMSGPAPKEDLL
jgi:hypothetical protein